MGVWRLDGQRTLGTCVVHGRSPHGLHGAASPGHFGLRRDLVRPCRKPLEEYHHHQRGRRPHAGRPGPARPAPSQRRFGTSGGARTVRYPSRWRRPGAGHHGLGRERYASSGCCAKGRRPAPSPDPVDDPASHRGPASAVFLQSADGPDLAREEVGDVQCLWERRDEGCGLRLPLQPLRPLLASSQRSAGRELSSVQLAADRAGNERHFGAGSSEEQGVQNAGCYP
mmetsp:Transcript_66024/g.137890  ORF Transcript_66024/g.137890 Transcript_66024/m.137890 type:complete len:226 (-) Transcript_66024:140-817(-)